MSHDQKEVYQLLKSDLVSRLYPSVFTWYHMSLLKKMDCRNVVVFCHRTCKNNAFIPHSFLPGIKSQMHILRSRIMWMYSLFNHFESLLFWLCSFFSPLFFLGGGHLKIIYFRNDGCFDVYSIFNEDCIWSDPWVVSFKYCLGLSVLMLYTYVRLFSALKEKATYLTW